MSTVIPAADLPTMTPVKSSNIESIGHDGDALHVKFRSGGHFSYAGVPAELHDQMAVAESPGKFFAGHVRDKFKLTRHP